VTSNEALARGRAEEFRRNNGLSESTPIGDVFEFVQRTTGVDVMSVKADAAEYGLLMQDTASGRACIAVSVNTHPMRQRSSVIHELGHLLAGDLDGGKTLPSGVRNDAEVQADAFCRHLLLPLNAVGEGPSLEASDTSTLSALVQTFGVSPAIAAIQLRKAGRITSRTCTVWMNLSTRQVAAVHGWLERYDQLAAASDEPRAPQGLLARAIAAYQAGVLSINELAVWYRRDPTELEAELGVPDQSPATDSDPWDSTASIFGAPAAR
jgi:hypothetical protein